MPPFNPPTDADLENRFCHHPPVSEEQVQKYASIRAKALEFAKLIRDLTPCSPEQTRAINAVDEAMMLANAGISRYCP
jgi:hypothetical protein